MAKAFRDALYADPYNYRTDVHAATIGGRHGSTTVADDRVQAFEAEAPSNNMMTGRRQF